MDIRNIKNKIKKSDNDILMLFKKRFELSLLEKRVSTVSKEGSVCTLNDQIDNLSSTSKLFGKDFIKTYDQLMNREISSMLNKPFSLIGFQGDHGAYSEIASKNFNNDLIPIPCKKFSDIVIGVDKDIFEVGLLPIENSIEGAVNEVNDLLIYSDLQIVGEVYQPIDHCLLTLKETNYREIKHVYSHPQALAQCRGFIYRNQLESFPYYDTAGAAKMLSRKRQAATAVIASKSCAKLYDLEIIKENIADKSINFTRFLILSKAASQIEGDKSSIIFTAKDEAGALYSILELFKSENINLSRIESRPFKEKPGNYVFFVDFSGSDRDEKVKGILNKIKNCTIFYKFLGCYKGKCMKT